MANQWKIAEEAAAKHGKTMDRRNWRVVVNAHIAEDDEQALAQHIASDTTFTFQQTIEIGAGHADGP